MRPWLLCTVLLAACDDDSTLDLDERRFRLQSGREPVAGTSPQLTFDEGELTFYAGCNTHSGDYSIRSGKLVTANLQSTNIGCDPARASQDDFFAAFLIDTPALALSGATLTLTGSSGTLVFAEDD